MTIPNAHRATARPGYAGWLAATNDITQQFLEFGGRPGMISLAGGLPAAELYPLAEIEAATQRALSRHGAAALEYGSVAGLPELREAIAARMSAETGGRFGPENVLITSGSMQGLSLIGTVLLDAGDLIVTQTPTYLGALDGWRPRLPTYRRLDWDRLDGHEALDDVFRRAKFAYAVPNYSNPTGVLVPQDRRAALLAMVERTGVWLIEDDPYHTMALDGPPGRSILARCAEGCGGRYDGPVVYLGTVSKSLVPGLRCGWVVAEPGLIATLAMAKQSTDMSGSMLTQAIALDLLDRGFDRAHAATMLATYRERRDALCDEAALRLRRWFDFEVPVGGMFVWLRARDGAIDTDALYRYAVARDVAFVPSSVFDFDVADRSAIRLNFTRSPPERIREGVRRLEAALLEYLAAPAPAQIASSPSCRVSAASIAADSAAAPAAAEQFVPT